MEQISEFGGSGGIRPEKFFLNNENAANWVIFIIFVSPLLANPPLELPMIQRYAQIIHFEEIWSETLPCIKNVGGGSLLSPPGCRCGRGPLQITSIDFVCHSFFPVFLFLIPKFFQNFSRYFYFLGGPPDQGARRHLPPMPPCKFSRVWNRLFKIKEIMNS